MTVDDARRADGRALVPHAAQARAIRDQSMGKFEAGRIFVLIDRGDYWQCAYVIPKGTIEDMHRAGLEAFRQARRRQHAVLRRPCSAS